MKRILLDLPVTLFAYLSAPRTPILAGQPDLKCNACQCASDQDDVFHCQRRDLPFPGRLGPLEISVCESPDYASYNYEPKRR